MITKILILILLISINGLFSCSEVAFLSLDKIVLKEDSKKNKKAKNVKKLLENPDNFLATIQVVITLAGFLASAFAADSFTNNIIEYLKVDSNSIIRTIILIIITLLLSYITLIFGELIPKKIGLSSPNKIAYETSRLLIVSRKIFAPFVFLLTKSVDLISKIFNIKSVEEEKLTEDRIKKVIGLGKEEGVLEIKESDIILNVFEFNDTTAEIAMTKMENVISIRIEDNIDKIISLVKKYKFTRYPVYEKDQIIGILNIKDFILNHEKPIKELLRKPIKVKKDEKIDDIFKKMKRTNTGMMIVENIGIITTEDILEELVGSIKDEYN